MLNWFYGKPYFLMFAGILTLINVSICVFLDGSAWIAVIGTIGFLFYWAIYVWVNR